MHRVIIVSVFLFVCVNVILDWCQHQGYASPLHLEMPNTESNHITKLLDVAQLLPTIESSGIFVPDSYFYFNIKGH